MTQNLVLKYFTEICKIPHTSGNEKKLASYVTGVLKQAGAKVKTDSLGNLYVTIPGTLHVPGICLQAHLDMVGEKIASSNHNFNTDPINYYEENGWIKAKGTTLGADNGIGVAIILALFTDKTVTHGPLEAVFTIEEETTTIGACKLKNNILNSKYLINVDGEMDDQIIVGNGGSCDFIGHLPLQRAKCLPQTSNLTLRLSGGLGGHSGSEIHLIRINAIVEMMHILKKMRDECHFLIVDIQTGHTLNTVPSWCEVTINLPKNKMIKFKNTVSRTFDQFKKTHAYYEKDLSLKIAVAKSFADSLTSKSSDTIMNIISAANNGMNIFDFDLNIPQTSSNLGKVILASKQAEFGWLQRSNKPYCLAKLNNKLISLFELAGGTYEISSYTDSLDPAFDNPFALQIQSIAKKYFKHKANITATHTVLELGTIVTHYPNMIAVSIGANIRSPHTPNEKVEISSVLYTYNLLKKVLQEIN